MSTYDLHQMINRLHAETDSRAVKAIYDEWASFYDEELDELGYLGPGMAAAIFEQYVSDKESLILDAGCGTGLVGQKLSERGYRNLHGCDYSEQMLAVADTTGSYKSLAKADFMYPLSIASDTYDGLISVGVMGPRIPLSTLDEFVRITRSEGIICLTTRLPWFEAATQSKIAALKEARKIDILALQQRAYMFAQNAEAMYCVLRVL